jgi:hypothetical protein
MVQAELDDGQRLLALNEIFVGHRTHQSARYRLGFGRASEHLARIEAPLPSPSPLLLAGAGVQDGTEEPALHVGDVGPE